MASPFHVFRKHQKAMMVVVGVLCMIGFSIAGVIDYSTDRGRGVGDDPVVATAYGKNIRAGEVQQLIRRRALAINFMAQCKAAAMNFPDFAPIFANQFEAYVFGPATEQDVVKTWILDERARQMGMVVDDQAINAFIREQTQNKVKADVFRDISQRLGVGSPQVFDALRGELLAFRLREMALSGMQSTPAQRWDYYRRQKQRATVEAVPLRVEDFIDQVPDAPDDELRAFFDAHKDEVPNPESPVPGFKVPQKASFKVVVARFNDFLVPDSVTEDEVKEHYEKFKDTRYLWNEFAFDEADEDQPAATSDTPAEKSDNKANGDDKGAGDKADETKADTQGADGNPPESDKERDESKSDEQSSLPGAADALASFMARPAAAIGGLLAADDTDSTSDAKPTDPASSADEAASNAEKPADSTDEADQEPASTTKKVGGDKSTNKKKVPAVAPPITSEYLLPRDIRQGTHPKHAPLWQVEDAIRKELAREKANKRIDDALRVVREKMRKHARLMDPEDTELKMPDLEEVAKSQGLSVIETGQLTELELTEKFPDLASASGEQKNIPFSTIAFAALAKFQSTTVQDVEGDRYLVWKTDEQDAYAPEFADVRSKVLRVWKITKARDLAVKKAKDLAEEANKAQKSLKELFADREGLTVIQTPPFSWLTRGTANVDNRSPLRESEIDGVDSPGSDFMREVFNLGAGATGEALNKPQTIAYVVRVVNLDPAREVLRAGFMSDPFPLYREVAQEDMQHTHEAWIKGIEAEARLTWKNPSR